MKIKHILVFSFLYSLFLSGNTKPNEILKIKKGFRENKGQILDQNNSPNKEVKFLFNQPGINVQLKENSFSYDTYVSTERNDPAYEKSASELKIKNKITDVHYHRVDVELLHSNLHPQIHAIAPIQGVNNYYSPYYASGSVMDVKTYEKVIYKNIYPNIDLEFYSENTGKNECRVEYQFILNPGANINEIKLRYHGADKIELDHNKIKIKVAHGYFTEQIPKSFLKENNKTVSVNYKMIDKNTIGLSLEIPYLQYSGKTLIIDPYPALSWATYYGGVGGPGTGDEYGFTITTDPSGNVIMGGMTGSTVNIASAFAYQSTKSALNDGFIAKFTSSGTRIWGTYYGGNADVEIHGVTTDATSNIYFTGRAIASTGIATPGAQQVINGGTGDAFIVKFDLSGNRIWGTYCGGTGMDEGNDITTDSLGNVIMVGSTNSATGIASGGAYQTAFGGGPSTGDAMIEKYTPGGIRIWGTYYGDAGEEDGKGITCVNSYVCFCGSTTSSLGIASPGAQQTVYGGGPKDGFLATLDFNGQSRISGTYLGGTGEETIEEVAHDASANIFITGVTTSTANISTPGSYQTVYGGGNNDAFIGKYLLTGSSTWCTYYGGTNNDYGYSLVTDASNNILVGGYSISDGSVVTSPGAYQRPRGCSPEALIVKMSNSGARLWATYFGDPYGDPFATAIAERSGNIYICGTTFFNTSYGTKLSTSGAHQVNFGGGLTDAFLAKFTEVATPFPPLSISGPTTVCNNTAYVYTVSPVNGYILGPNNYFWSFPWGTGTSTVSTYTTTTPPVGSGGTATVNPNCDASINATIGITQISSPGLPGTITGNTLVCSGSVNTYSISTVTGATSYSWSLPAGWSGVSNTNTISIMVGASPGSISVTANNSCGPGPSQTLSVTVSNPQLTLTPTPVTCFGMCNGSITASVSGGIVPYTYPSSSFTGLCGGTHTIYVTDNLGCNSQNTVNIIQPLQLTLNTTNVNNATCNGSCNGTYTLSASGGTPLYSFSPSVSSNTLCAGIYTVTVTDANACFTSSVLIINEPSPLTASINTANSSICIGNSSTLTVNSTGGTGPATYSWSTSSSNTMIVVSPTTTSTYSVDVTDANSCSNTSQITITVNPLPTVTAATSTFCSGTTGCLYGGGALTYAWYGPCAFSSTLQNPCFVYSGFCGCVFTCVGTDANGCTNTATVCMNFLPNPTVTAVTSNSLLCAGQTSTLTSNGALTYSWSTSATGSTTAVSPTVSTTYSVTGTDANGCTNSTSITQSVSTCTGILQSGISSPEFEVFPNPTSDELILRTGSKENLSVEIYNVIGEMILKQNIKGIETKINLSEQATGIYFLKVIDNGETIHFSKVIKQ